MVWDNWCMVPRRTNPCFVYRVQLWCYGFLKSRYLLHRVHSCERFADTEDTYVFVPLATQQRQQSVRFCLAYNYRGRMFRVTAVPSAMLSFTYQGCATCPALFGWCCRFLHVLARATTLVLVLTCVCTTYVSHQLLSIVVLRIFGNPRICGQHHVVDSGLRSEGGSPLRW